jgi:iron(III) transport system substrate-binding protein
MRRPLALFSALALVLVACQPAARSQPTGSAPAAAAPASTVAAPSAPASGHSAEVERLLAAARDNGEPELNLFWSETSFGGTEGARQMGALFNRLYGTDVKVNFTPGPPMPDVAARISQELAAGHRAASDILLGTETHFGAMLARDVLEEYDYTRLSPRIPPEVVSARNIGVEIATFISGVTYNSDLVRQSEAPRKLEDVLNPQWKGKIASTPYAAQFDRIAALPGWGPDRMKAFLTEFTRSLGGVMRCGENTRLISGEFIMFAMDCGDYYARRDKQRGAPLEQSVLEDGATTSFFYWGIPRNAAHPNLAKLWINTAMSEEGQRLIYSLWATDHRLLPGSQTAAPINALKARGVEILDIDAEYVLAHPELTQLNLELQKIIQQQ